MVVLPVNWLLIKRRTRTQWKLFMLAASYYFYAYWNPRFVLLLVASTIFNQLCGLAIHRARNELARRGILTVAVVGNLGALAYFKYYDFFISSMQNLLDRVGIEISPEILSITLPVGISFFTFQALSYVIDIFRREIEPTSLIDFAVYESFFPHVVAGPIVRAAEFLPQLKERHDPRRIDASKAFFLIFIGLFKKVVLANFLATEIVDQVFANPEQYSSLESLFAIYGYAVQIYCDFSGYTDMAIGLALLLGFRFPQNFDNPYSAVSLQDFWRRWHMTLSRWLRDYLYIPLGGNRGSDAATYRNLMITMLLGGLWHGADWTFVIWGGIHGGFLALEHGRQKARERRNLPELPDTALRRSVRRFVTFQIVCFAWVFFRAESVDKAFELLGRLLPQHWFESSPSLKLSILIAIAVGIGSQYIPNNAIGRAMAAFSRLSPVSQGVVLGFALLVTNTLGPRGVAPFIYFQF
jgi:D-alanyl-lipoteichoic acid acyltransferase DltB (MBOAT superfamily)